MGIKTIGAIARIDDGIPDVRGRLDRLPGVETFEVGDPDRTGVIIEAIDLDEAHRLLTEDVAGAAGVLGVWPVYIHLGDDEEREEIPTRTSQPPVHEAEGACYALDPT